MSAQIVKVRDVMTREVLSIDGMASAKDAAQMMRDHGVSELLVAKRNEHDAWGIVTIMDMVKNVIVPGRKSTDVFVYEIMTKPILTVPADMDIRYAIRLIERLGFRRAPVEHHGEIIGMITLYNLVLENSLI
ncbi:histidine kinase [Oceanidesulfovibrio indonesiensis]|uniref:Histidine kinase n=1 Tax=Oceanidesulfovibrio indonesiensis TaxID=54767 RepID=A0A7M3MIK2_9BACT|nr:CBS domain-containing protein [Oceanidesulfovibrio indonesiensis]TVM19399.1 histidine kinase [Oceanidesulfovibrio indonesiensis]